jgi:hypothetical protein
MKVLHGNKVKKGNPKLKYPMKKLGQDTIRPTAKPRV